MRQKLHSVHGRKDSEIYEFVLKNYSKLSFSPQVEGLVVKKR